MVSVLEGTSIALATQAAGVLQDKLDLPAKAFSYLTSTAAWTWSTSSSSSA